MNRNELDHAKKFPIFFSQVREDPRVDLEIINTIQNPKITVLMIASGGCTLGVLAEGTLKFPKLMPSMQILHKSI